MRLLLTLIAGVLIGQWLAFSGVESPADVHRMARTAWARADFDEAARQWSRAVTLQPDNAYFNYMRAAALARLGHRAAATDALQYTLLLNPEEALARQVRQDLTTLAHRAAADGTSEAVIALETSRGVWIAPVVVNGHRGRFLVDTGASVVVIAPAFATRVGVVPRGNATLDMETLGGRARAPWATLSTIRVGTAELQDHEVVIHHPGGDLDGILGNTFLNRWDVHLDPDRRLLRLRRTTQPDAVYASPR